MIFTECSTWPPAHAQQVVVREDACAADPSAPMKNWVYDAPAIGFVLSGWFDYLTDGGVTFAAPGAVVFGNAGERFSVRHHDKQGNTRLVVSIRPELLEEVASAAQIEPRFQTAPLPPGQGATRIFAWMRNIAVGGLRAEDLEYALVTAALTAAPQHSAHHQISARDKRRVTIAVRHIDACFNQPCSLQTLADIAQSSRYHLLRTFGAVVGQTPNQYLINARVRAAAERLRATSMPIAEVALGVGFNDISHFYVCFRAAFACTPRQWRLSSRH